jgi:endonuclease YncB( thermonuclease family)
MLARLCLVLLLSLSSNLAHAETLHGPAVVVDGDTLRVSGIPVRLQGIAAPELREPGGKEAKAYLAEMVQDQTVVCELTRERTRGRRVGICRVDGEDLAGQVIAAGLARDCPRYSKGRYASCLVPECSVSGLP